MEEENKYFLNSQKVAERIKKEIFSFCEEKNILILGRTLKAKVSLVDEIIDSSLAGKYDTLYIDDENGFGFITFINRQSSIEIFFGFHESRDLFVSKNMLFKALYILKKKYNCNKFWFSFCPRDNFKKYEKFIVSYLGFKSNDKDKRFEIEI